MHTKYDHLKRLPTPFSSHHDAWCGACGAGPRGHGHAGAGDRDGGLVRRDVVTRLPTVFTGRVHGPGDSCDDGLVSLGQVLVLSVPGGLAGPRQLHEGMLAHQPRSHQDPGPFPAVEPRCCLNDKYEDCMVQQLKCFSGSSPAQCNFTTQYVWRVDRFFRVFFGSLLDL